MGETTKASEESKKKSFFAGIKSELKKVVWPTKDTLVKETTAVMIVSIVLGLIISLIDLGFKIGFDRILQL